MFGGVLGVGLVVGLLVGDRFEPEWAGVLIGGGSMTVVMLSLALLVRKAFGVDVIR